jgi:hypothetical protein
MIQMNSKVENEKGLVAQLQKMVKELQVIIITHLCTPVFRSMGDDWWFGNKLSAKVRMSLANHSQKESGIVVKKVNLAVCGGIHL